MKTLFLFLIAFTGIMGLTQKEAIGNPAPVDCPVLLYHRFGPTVTDDMTVTDKVFESHLEYLKSHGYTVVSLRTLVDTLRNPSAPPLPQKSVAICVDDGHITVYSNMLPIVKKANIPVTLFIYPSAISNASYAMTWEQVKSLKDTGLFDIQAHTFWHPNFKKEKKKQKPAEYEKFVDIQLSKAKNVLEKKTGSKVDLIAWPFGIYDDYLLSRAEKAGYTAGFTIEAHHATRNDGVMKLPRYLLNNASRGKGFEWIFINKAGQ